jgi:Fe-S cluster assembly protein SufD
MTGSSSNLSNSLSNELSAAHTTAEHVTTSAPNLASKSDHAMSSQWSELVAAAANRAVLMRAQPEAWWSAQAERLSAKWLASGLPTTRLEEWKYTNLAGLHAKARTAALCQVQVTAPKGVRVLRLSQTAAEADMPLQTKSSVRALLEIDEDIFFENLSKSMVADPLVILVPSQLSSETPIEINWQGLPLGQWGFGVAVVIVGEGAKVSLIEKYGVEVDAQAFVTSVEIGRGAKLSHLRLQMGASNSDHGYVFASTRAKVLRDASYETAQVSFGSKLSREDLTVELVEAGAEAITDGVFIGRSTQVLDHHTNLVHRVGNTTSGQIYKGVLADESRGVFNGRIAISKNASGSNSSQMNKNLLLSKKVELDTKPQLEIDNDDVKAAHGAAIGRLDSEHIFYLRSRGIGMAQAVEMLARGFAKEAVSRISSPVLRELGNSEIERGLAGLSWEAL